MQDLPDDWQHDQVRRALSFVRGRFCAIDVGAHRGIITRLLLDEFAHVVAIEPSELADRIPADAEVIRAAAGRAAGRCGLQDGKSNTGQRHVVAGDSVPVITLDSFGLRPDFIKIDVEGMELDVLLGAETTIRAHHPVVMFEENGLNARYGVADGACHDLLRSWGARQVAQFKSGRRDRDYVFAWDD